MALVNVFFGMAVISCLAMTVFFFAGFKNEWRHKSIELTADAGMTSMAFLLLTIVAMFFV